MSDVRSWYSKMIPKEARDMGNSLPQLLLQSWSDPAL